MGTNIKGGVFAYNGEFAIWTSFPSDSHSLLLDWKVSFLSHCSSEHPVFEHKCYQLVCQLSLKMGHRATNQRTKQQQIKQLWWWSERVVDKSSLFTLCQEKLRKPT